MDIDVWVYCTDKYGNPGSYCTTRADLQIAIDKALQDWDQQPSALREGTDRNGERVLCDDAGDIVARLYEDVAGTYCHIADPTGLIESQPAS
jgi:hypothetical protein